MQRTEGEVYIVESREDRFQVKGDEAGGKNGPKHSHKSTPLGLISNYWGPTGMEGVWLPLLLMLRVGTGTQWHL